jgi:formylmethanofuran dehydrogenase subunit E
MSECERCGENINRGYPLDAVAHSDSWVCKDCLKDTDEVVDV